MSQHNCTYQQQHTVSIRRDKLIEVASIENLEENVYRVFLVLLTQLDGYTKSKNSVDPMNFKKVNVEQIADTLNIKKKEVKSAIETLFNLYLLDEGSNETVKNGYRFTF